MLDENPFHEVLKGNICLSGGAKGADAQWGMMAGRAGQSVIHWSFSGHKHSVAEEEIVKLTPRQLEKADQALKTASRTIKKSWPGNRSKNVKNLLRRNYYQVQWSDALYAVATIKDGVVQGGTGWAVQMYLDRHASEALFQPLRAYVFDQHAEQWYQYKAGWQALSEAPPTPMGIWAGIGTRDLNDAGKWAIRELLGWVKPVE